MGGRGYRRTGWIEPRAGTKVSRLIALLRARAVTSAEVLAETGVPQNAFSGAMQAIQDQYGYIVASWPDPSAPHVRRYLHRFRITGRLAWGGGVAEDYTVGGV